VSVNETGRLMVVVGGQFGSEGKGHLTAELAARSRADRNSLVIRVGGPNAGHTVWADGQEYKLRHLPTPIAVRKDYTVALGAQSVINPEVLRAELEMFPGRYVVVDPSATVLEPEHIAAEEGDDVMQNIGSTRKGIGAARAARIRRTARTAFDLWGDQGSELDPRIICSPVSYLAEATLGMGADVIVEGAQGYGLGLHSEFYPHCTSSDCTAMDVLAQAQISPWAFPNLEPEVWVAVRPYPIRVAGTSGPLRGETSWAALGLPEERTTVTNKVRRVGSPDWALVADAVRANGGSANPKTSRVRLALMMADQVFPELSGLTEVSQLLTLMGDGHAVEDYLTMVAEETGARIAAIGTGPETMVMARDALVTVLA
jgi:adenylosuccinate synthase